MTHKISVSGLALVRLQILRRRMEEDMPVLMRIVGATTVDQ